MNLKNYYWYFNSVLPPEFCDRLINHANNKKEYLGITGGLNKPPEKFTKKELKEVTKKRRSNVVWMEDPWIYETIQPFIHIANKNAGWNFEWDWSETCQFTKYKKNQFYDWHCDSYELPFNKPEAPGLHGKIRKLSVTCSLSDPKDYKGGELEFNFNNPEFSKKVNIQKCTEILPRGSIVVFPSFVWHRVRPVTSGTRYSLVIWNLGYPFK
jgi:PKHD-type hydroxylase